MAILNETGLAYLWEKIKAYFTKERLGLGNVDNTSDATKNVAFASEAAAARKLNYNLIIRLKGGRTEGSDMWTFDGSTSKSINVTAAKIGAVAVSQGTANAGKIFYVGEDGNATLIDIATLKTLINS